MKVGSYYLEWSDALATGVDRIDEQHRTLISILNAANRCFREQANQEARLQVMADLVGYTVYHFDCEEEMMDAAAFGERRPTEELAHVNEHRTFARATADYQAALRAGEPVDGEALFAFLNNWLVNHVLGTDQKLGAYLRSTTRGA